MKKLKKICYSFAIEIYCWLKPGQFINFLIFRDWENFLRVPLATPLFGSIVFLLGGGP